MKDSINKTPLGSKPCCGNCKISDLGFETGELYCYINGDPTVKFEYWCKNYKKFDSSETVSNDV